MAQKTDTVLRFRWIAFVSRRFSRVDKNGRSAVTSFFASLGICFGIMTLIVVMSVMNGFQMEFKNAIMEVSSYHMQVRGVTDDTEARFTSWCENEKDIVSANPFYEAQSFMAASSGGQAAALIRALPADIARTDAGFAREMLMVSGSFAIEDDDAIVLGSSLADSLGVRTGGEVTLLALSGGSDVALLSRTRRFRVTGIFYAGYADINASYAFINIESGKKNFGRSAEKVYGIKLRHESLDAHIIGKINKMFPTLTAVSWREYNRSFFGALRVEKNMLMILVLLIFVVVAINIYSGMRRLVYERRREISILAALGGKGGEIKSIFILRGFFTGCAGAAGGVLLGLLLCVNIGGVFLFASEALYYTQYFFTLLFSPESAAFVRENPMFMLYASVPARIFPLEVFAIALFGIASPLAASYAASRDVLKMTVAEVLHDE